jgi:hypothetical protein
VPNAIEENCKLDWDRELWVIGSVIKNFMSLKAVNNIVKDDR